MNGNTVTTHYPHAHHQISAALFVGSLIVGASMILSAELTKPARYEYHANPTGGNNYVIFDNDTGRAADVQLGAENPLVEKTNK